MNTNSKARTGKYKVDVAEFTGRKGDMPEPAQLVSILAG